MISPEQGRTELDAVLASRSFAKATSLQLLLRYICERFLEGKGEELKEYAIAVDVFGRGAEFDPRADSIVRVEASRLRKRLKQYYEGEGAAARLRIVLPAGRYVPEFVETAEAQPAPVTRPSFKLAWLAAAVVVMAAVAVTWAWQAHQGGAQPRPAAASSAKSAPAPAAQKAPPVAPLNDVHILAGRTTERYTDTFGTVWTGDRFFTGGKAYLDKRPVLGTRDEALYHGGRRGNCTYDIPLIPQEYELRLYFADDDVQEGRVEGGGENSRTMNISINGQQVLQQLDVFANAGGIGRAYVRSFRGVKPEPDGQVHIRIGRMMGSPAFINALELRPMASGRVRPIRIAASDKAFFDHAGVAWFADTFVSGGHLVARDNVVTGRYDAGLFRGERFGRFSYTLPLPPGRYTVALYFAETYWGPSNPGKSGVGRRLFNVFCNHTPLLKNFDIQREAGGENRGICRKFSGLEPDVHGKLTLEFVPVRNYPCINAIEVTEDAR